MSHKLGVLAIAIASAISVQTALAELYISPILREIPSSAFDHSPQVPVSRARAEQEHSKHQYMAAGVKENLAPAPAPAAAPAPAVASAPLPAPAPAPKLLHGKGVPVKQAIQNLVGKTWVVILEPGTENIKASWSNASDWTAAISQIASHTGLKIEVNNEARRIAVTRSELLSKKLLEPGQSIWKLESGKTLRENLDSWAAKAGWKVDWSGTSANYPVDHSATLVGAFAGKGGVVDKVLTATSSRSVPLAGHFYHGNSVVVVYEGGYKPEQAASRPSVDEEI